MHRTSLRLKPVHNGICCAGRENGAQDVRLRLAGGIEIDSVVHDPEGWYLQFELDVLDSYGGFLPGVGPVDSIRPEVTKILRAQRFARRAVAEACALQSVRAAPTGST